MARPRRTTAPLRGRVRVGAQHADWLTLIEPAGQFLTLPVLRRAFPDGLPQLDPDTRREVRERAAAMDWSETGQATVWIEYLLRDVLHWGERLRTGPQIPDHVAFTVPEHHATLRPEYILANKDGGPRVLVERYPVGTQLDRRPVGDRWAASPIDRTGVLCRALGVIVGLVTNGRDFTVVYAPPGSVGGHATFDTSLFAEGSEANLLNAFAAVLGAQRFFAAAAPDQLEGLLTESATSQADVTNTLGLQVRRAVELLVASISRANLDSDGKLLAGVAPNRVYEAAATTIMRLVFLLYAEERNLLPLGEQLYDDNYAASTLYDQLTEQSDRFGDEPLELRSAAWQRLLATFRAVYAGITHDRLRMPPYGGGLFDPDRFGFLEGRTDDQPWDVAPAHPLPVDDLTVREILRALQFLTTTQAGATESRRLSFRTLDVEQIGHIYEGTLDHSALIAQHNVVGLIGKQGVEPEVELRRLEDAAAQGRARLVALLAEETGRTGKQIEKLLDTPLDDDTERRLRTATHNDASLTARIASFAHLLREDLRGLPIVFVPGAIYVTETTARRDTGTEYTPRELAEEIVTHALEPLVYAPGPAEGAERAVWVLKPSQDILKLRVCDPAVGSGAILVAACRYLADRLLEAWAAEGAVPAGYQPDPVGIADEDDLLVMARRAVADHCLFGVDRDPMAVEMAKLSLWLTTMSRERPFTFVDHAIVAGDSLLGVTSLDQITAFNMDPDRGRRAYAQLFVEVEAMVDPLVQRAIDLRRQMTDLAVVTVRDVQRKERLHEQARTALAEAGVLADLVVGAALASNGQSSVMDTKLVSVQRRVLDALKLHGQPRADAFAELQAVARAWLDAGRPDGAPPRRPLHWPLAFPDVMVAGGFHAMVGNPPYIGNKYWKARIGPDFQPYWSLKLRAPLGKPDIISVFLLQMTQLLTVGGIAGSLATQSVSEVDSRRFVERHVLGDHKYIRAVSRRTWPGSANVEIAQVWISDSSWSGITALDGRPVSVIDAGLTGAGGAMQGPDQLEEVSAFQGVDNSRGLAFVVGLNHPVLRASDGSSGLFRPYVSGTDITEAPPLSPSRFVLDLTGFQEQDLARLPRDAAEFLATVVRPTRTPEELSSYRGLAQRWWTFWNTREADLTQAREAPVVLAMPAISQYLVAFMLPSDWVYTNQIQLVHDCTAAIQATLLSCAFDTWFSHTGGTFGASGRRLKVKPVLGTFPILRGNGQATLEGAATRWQQLVTDGGAIPNEVLGAMHHGSERPVAISLRENQITLDRAVLTGYGWDDIDPRHGFYDTAQGRRFTIHPEARAEILDRLLELNHQRNAEEVAAGLHEKGAKKRAARSAVPSAQQTAGLGQEGLF